jgi:hypothetical protein
MTDLSLRAAHQKSHPISVIDIRRGLTFYFWSATMGRSHAISTKYLWRSIQPEGLPVWVRDLSLWLARAYTFSATPSTVKNNK